MTFQHRSIISKPGGEAPLRVVWTEPGKTWTIRLQSKTNVWPTLLPEKEHEFYREVDQPATPALTVAAHKHAQHTFSRFAAALNDIPLLLMSQGRTRAFTELVAEEKRKDPHGKTLAPATFYKVVRNWLRGGGVVAALSPEWKGNKKPINLDQIDEMNYEAAKRACQAQSERLAKLPHEEPIQSDHTKKGMPRKLYAVHSPTCYSVDRSTVRVFRKFFHAKLKSEGRQTLRQAHKELLREVFRTLQPTGPSKAWPDWVVPSFRQFEDWFNRMTTHRERRVAARGQHYFELNERALLGQGVSHAYTAGTEGQLDATVWNVNLVSELAGAALIGPPIVFRIRCADTGNLLGLSVGLESASWMGAATAIHNCVEDKVEFCKRFDIHIDADEWKVRGLPATLVADCGETHNHKPNRFITATNTNLKNLQRARGDLKPGVESDFHTLQVQLNGQTPSAFVKAYEETTMKQWRMKASMTLWEFTRVLILAELIRMRAPRLGLQLPATMIAAGADSSPRSMWNWCAQYMPTALRTFSEEEVRLSLLDTDAGSITEHGVFFKGIYYLAKSLIDAGAFEIARERKRRSIVIAYDPRLVDTVYIMEGEPENPSSYVRCELNVTREDQLDFAGKTFREVMQNIRKGDRQNHAAEAAARPVTDGYADEQKKTIAASEARVKMARATHATNPHAQEKGRAQARETEKNAKSPQQALVDAAASATPVAPAQPAQTNHSQNVVPILSSTAKKVSAFAARAAAAKMKPIDPAVQQRKA